MRSVRLGLFRQKGRLEAKSDLSRKVTPFSSINCLYTLIGVSFCYRLCLEQIGSFSKVTNYNRPGVNIELTFNGDLPDFYL